MTDKTLCYKSASTISAMIRERKISPVEVVENSLSRIEEVNPALNCFCFTYPEEALKQAKLAEKAVFNGNALGPLHGVPIAIKDLTPTKGKRTTMGSYVFENWVPDFDAIVVENLLNAGAILVGKTTTPEFAYASSTDSPLWGITRNPWNLEMTPGGSSGGSAAAVASGCVPLAEGSDAGGSIRIPASHCGIVGMKPSFGRIPFEFMASQFDWMFCHGSLSRTVEDAALFLKVCQGPDIRDIQTLTSPVDMAQGLSIKASKLRIALSPDLGCYQVDADVEKNLRNCASLLKDAGCVVEEVDLSWTPEFIFQWWEYWDIFMAAHFGKHLKEYREQMHPIVVKAIENGITKTAVEARQIEFTFTEAWKKLMPILQSFDALMCPTESFCAPPVASGLGESVSITPEGKLRCMDMTPQFNALRLPVISLPSGFSQNNLPTGLQIVGRRNDDIRVLQIAKLLENLCLWKNTTPPI